MNRYDFRPIVWLFEFAIKTGCVAVIFLIIAAVSMIMSGKV